MSMPMNERTTSDSSFILVDKPSTDAVVDLELLSSLVQFFPSIHQPHQFRWDYVATQDIERTRQLRPDGRLYIDELLSLVGLDGPSLFPPASASALNSLLFALLSSDHDQLKTRSILYYLLLAHDPTLSDAFAQAFLLPIGFVKAVQGFHALDTGKWQQAVAALTDPHLIPDFIPKTLQVLASGPPVDERAACVLSYWRLSGISLATEQECGIILDALCDQTRKRGVIEAWSLQRRWKNDHEREHLIKRILSRTFGDNARSKPAPQHVKALLAQPFTSEEDSIVDAFCLSPPSSEVAKSLATDWRLSKLIAESRPLVALKYWSLAKPGVPASDDRLRLLKAVRATLTEVQKSSLALEEDVDVLLNSKSNSTQAEAAKATTTSKITQPAWQSVPAAAPTPLPRSLLSIPSRSNGQSLAKAPSSADLPLSASPFLRREKPLVSSIDGSSLGGVQKSVLLALREGNATPIAANGSPKAATPTGERVVPLSSTASLFGMSPSRSNVAGSSTQFGAGSPLRKPTLSGFGSVRQPSASTHYGKARGVEESSAGFDAARRGNFDRSLDDRAVEDDDLGMMSPPPIDDEGEDEPQRRRRPEPAGSSKRKNVSNGTLEKRRAVSTEAEDRPSSSVKVSNTKASSRNGTSKKKPPGAFPGIAAGFESESHDEDNDGHDQQKVTKSRRAGTATKSKTTNASRRSSARAPSEPSTPKTSTRRSTKSASILPEEDQAASERAQQETPKAGQNVRRSTRLRTPAKDDDVLVPTSASKSSRKVGATAKGKARRKIIEEADEE